MKAGVLAKMLSAAFVSVALWSRFALLPFMPQSQIQQALVAIGVLAWPSAILPWLSGRLSAQGRYLFGLSGVILGYWIQGQPLVAFTYERMLFNVKLLPYLGGAALVLLGLVAATSQLFVATGARFKAWIPSCALIAALAWTMYAVIPPTAILSVKPGSLAMPALAVSDTYLFEAPDQTSLVGCRFGDVAVICGPEAVLIRFSDGTAKTANMSLNLGSLEVIEGGDGILVMDKKSGALHCFDATSGDFAWTTDGLGTVNQAKWSDWFGWFLNRPDAADFDPAEGEVVLNRVDLRSGARATWTLTPPDGWFWPEASDSYIEDWPGAQLGVCGESAFIQIAVRGDLTSQIPETAVFVAIPQDAPRVSWTLTQVPEGSNTYVAPGQISVAGGIAVISRFRDGGQEVVARDIESGEERWCHVIGGNGYDGRPVLVLPDKVLLDWSSFHNPLKTGLVCLDVLTGQEMWRYDRSQGWLVSMEPVGANTLVLSEPDPSTGDFQTDVTLLDHKGRPVWTYRAKSPAYTLRLEIGRAHV